MGGAGKRRGFHLGNVNNLQGQAWWKGTWRGGTAKRSVPIPTGTPHPLPLSCPPPPLPTHPQTRHIVIATGGQSSRIPIPGAEHCIISDKVGERGVCSTRGNHGTSVLQTSDEATAVGKVIRHGERGVKVACMLGSTS
jgi:hypothetical protein